MKVLHIITGLVQGGAEAVLFRVVAATHPAVKHTVVSLIDTGYYGKLFRELGVPVHALDMPRGRLSWQGLKRLHDLIGEIRPDVVQTWMYHANLLGALAARWAGTRGIVWGIHAATLDKRYDKLGTRIVGRLCALLSSVLPAATIYVSDESRDAHRAMGFRTRRESVVFNGVDLGRFAMDRNAGRKVREELGIATGERLLGFVARWDPYKDHANLLHAMSLLGEQLPRLRLVLAGLGIDADNRELVTLIEKYGLAGKVILAGARADVPAIMNALDLHVLSSVGEAFGNVTLEAMACGVPCVTTDVGSARLLVGELGWVVAPGDPFALAGGIERALKALEQRGKDALGMACRERAAAHFSIEVMVRGYVDVWTEIQGGADVS